ncbi:hypothetical protein KR026_004965 [Drosophila bipectinata]|nr:hypothetical protein KR026_004965 [Drosophila bipectinata]
MCPNVLMEKSLLPDCYIENQVILFSVLRTLQAEERPSESVDVQLRDRYDVFRQIRSSYPLPQNSTQDITIYVEGFENLTMTCLIPPPGDQSGEDVDSNGRCHMATMSGSATIPRSVLKEYLD